MYDSVWIITHHVLNKMVTESLGAETNNFKPLIQLPVVLNLIKSFCIHGKAMDAKWIPSKTIFIMQVVFMNTTPDMLPNKSYVNLKFAITLENKQLSI